MPEDFYIAVKVPYEKAQAARTFREWELIVSRALDDARWQNKTAAKSYWTRAIWDDLGRPKVDDRRAC